VTQPRIKVLVVDDSAVVRGLLVRALKSESVIEVVGTAMHGLAAISALKKQPADVVVLDVEMPVMDGLTALPHILSEFPHTRVIMASALTQEGAEPTVRALALGAAGCIAKPSAQSISASIEQLGNELVSLVKVLGQSLVSGRAAPHHTPPAAPVQPTREARFRPGLIVVGSSTGGPNALSYVLSELSDDVQCPILLVQHMPPTFTPMLARHLEKDSGRPCQEAVSGGLIERGRIYVAPGDYHLSIGRSEGRMITLLDHGPPQHFCRPSVNPLFLTAARHYGHHVLAVMLTGMGEDGIEGTREVAAKSGYIIAQDEASSVVWGMPGAVVREGLADEILPLNLIARAIADACCPQQAVAAT
jgi:two-component system, chemotaxis family, protein-glutamate methylesterase/glutaminase